MADPDDERTAAAGGHGSLRASHADREQAIDLLKVAFVQDRLTKDELDIRVGRALTARTGAELGQGGQIGGTAALPQAAAAPAGPRRPGA